MVARQDLTTDPDLQRQLLTARRGTAFFARTFNELSYDDLDEPSLVPGWTKRHVVAHVGYNARAISRLVRWARSGVEQPMYASAEARDAEIAFGATLPPIALIHLFEHSAIELSVEWRDLPDDRWREPVRTAQGRTVPVSETVWLRTREVWLHAIDLDSGARVSDIPEHVLDRLIDDVWAGWTRRGESGGLTLSINVGNAARRLGEGPTEVIGDLPSIVGWATGRTALGARAACGGAEVGLPAAPRWL